MAARQSMGVQARHSLQPHARPPCWPLLSAAGASSACREEEGSLRKTREAAKQQVRAIRAQYGPFELGAFLHRLVSPGPCPRREDGAASVSTRRLAPVLLALHSCQLIACAVYKHACLLPFLSWPLPICSPPPTHRPRSRAWQGCIKTAPTICTTRAEFAALKEQGLTALKHKAANGEAALPSYPAGGRDTAARAGRVAVRLAGRRL